MTLYSYVRINYSINKNTTFDLHNIMLTFCAPPKKSRDAYIFVPFPFSGCFMYDARTRLLNAFAILRRAPGSAPPPMHPPAPHTPLAHRAADTHELPLPAPTHVPSAQRPVAH